MKTDQANGKFLSDIWSLSLQLEPPHDFEQGCVADSVVFPENILVFSRETADQLQLNNPPYQHHRFVLLVSLDGTGDIRVDQQIVRFEPSSAILLFPFQIHEFLFFPKPNIRWLFITFETTSPLLLESLRNSIYILTSELLFLLHRLISQLVRGSISPERTVKAQLYLALILKELLISISFPLDSGVQESLQTVKLLEKVNQFIYANISHPFEIKELAQAIGYSESHLRNLFRRFVRISLGNYISNIRLRKATGLLHSGKLSISEVAETSGYSSLFAFSRAFRRALKCSPSEFRKEYQKPLT